MTYNDNYLFCEIISEVEVQGQRIRYMGKLPEEKLVFFTGTDKTSADGIHSIYQSVLEAVKHGYSIGYVPGTSYGNAIEKAMQDIQEGVLYCFVPKGLDSVPRRILSHALLTNGGVLSLSPDQTSFSLEALNRIKELGAFLADVTLVTEETLKFIPPFILTVVDNGKVLALLKSSLKSSACRNLAAEGCPTVQSFSDLLENSRFFTYPTDVGKYGILGMHFGIMDKNYGKW